LRASDLHTRTVEGAERPDGQNAQLPGGTRPQSRLMNHRRPARDHEPNPSLPAGAVAFRTPPAKTNRRSIRNRPVPAKAEALRWTNCSVSRVGGRLDHVQDGYAEDEAHRAPGADPMSTTRAQAGGESGT
jgi:hypothetical protein